MSVAGVINGLTQAIVAGKNYQSFKNLQGTTIGVQSLASGATTELKRIFKKNGLESLTSCSPSAAAISILPRCFRGKLKYIDRSYLQQTHKE